MKFSTGLSDGERERLTLLVEECAEVIQAASKILRHGYDSQHPGDTSSDNRRDLEWEIGDVAAALTLMTKAKDVNCDRITEYEIQKLSRVQEFLHFQPKELFE